MAYFVVSKTRIRRSSPRHFESIFDYNCHEEFEVETSLKRPIIPLRKSKAMM